MRLYDAVETFKRHAEYEESAAQVECPQRGRTHRTEPQSIWRAHRTEEQEQMSAACNKITQLFNSFCLHSCFLNSITKKGNQE